MTTNKRISDKLINLQRKTIRTKKHNKIRLAHPLNLCHLFNFSQLVPNNKQVRPPREELERVRTRAKKNKGLLIKNKTTNQATDCNMFIMLIALL